MSSSDLLRKAIAEISSNPEQLAAVHEHSHCVVLAGPGSGKTKTLTIAMAKTLHENIKEPRGLACITYNAECAIELESRLSKLGIEPSDRIFIGTVHSFALTQIILPYARCVLPDTSSTLRVATSHEQKAAIETAYKLAIGGADDPQKRWKFAEEKRRKIVDRNSPDWRDKNRELTDFIENYEAELRRDGLIDFDDMPLLAFRMVQENPWIRKSIEAKFPVLFVDEYQDLGHALHELVMLLCFQGGIRLFAVGDPDQSIYGFLGANPKLLEGLIANPAVHSYRLRFNYRCGTSIIQASLAALGEERDYHGPDGGAAGTVDFHSVKGDLEEQADFVVNDLLPKLKNQGTPLEEIAILYKWAKHGEFVANAAKSKGIPLVRADTAALVKRSSRLSRLVESCAAWVVGGWQDANPPFQRLAAESARLIFGSGASEKEILLLRHELIQFMQSTIGSEMTTHEWLQAFRREVLSEWRSRARTITEDWYAIDEMIRRTASKDEASEDLPLSFFGGRIEGSGRINLSTLHSAKGREFDAVILFGLNDDIIPNYYERKNETQLKEARRQFYVGVTRARHNLHLIFNEDKHSVFVVELFKRSQDA